MSSCKICGVGLIVSEEDEGICYSCEKIPEEQRVVSDKAKTELEKNNNNNNNKEKPATKIKTYKGKKNDAAKQFEKNAVTMEKEGYFPISQSYEPGTWGCGAFIVALLLCFILIGIIVFIYMLIVKPEGTLTVTYEYRGSTIKNNSSIEADEKTDEKACPQCAELVKLAAKVCRYCRYDFGEKDVTK